VRSSSRHTASLAPPDIGTAMAQAMRRVALEVMLLDQPSRQGLVVRHRAVWHSRGRVVAQDVLHVPSIGPRVGS